MSLRAVSDSTGTPRSENVVELLRHALDDAERGEIASVILVVEHGDGRTSSMWATAACMWPAKLLGALELCKTDWIDHFKERSRS